MTTSSRIIGQRLLPTLLCGVLLFAGGCKQETKHEQDTINKPATPVKVTVITATETITSMENEVVGTIEAVQRATISAKVTGTIAEMPVVLGATVKQGDLLVKLSAAEISARLAQAETAMAQAKRNLERERRLLTQNASTRETVNALEDAYQLAKSSQSEAKTMLSYITIRAPFSGLISSKLTNAGDLATVGTPLLILENTEALQAVAAVPEAQLLAIKPGDQLSVRIPASNLSATGTVAEIAPVADAISRSAVVKLDLEPSPSLRPGQFVRVILPGVSTKILLVPETAVSVFGQMERIFVIDNNTINMRLVRTGLNRDGKVEILSGLNPGEQVVVQAVNTLRDGQPARVTP
ncbi:MAG: efflux RND transporter periplasmic adaptor subunit [Proteobacteria bacterium]|nr:efflux RND transporter periplasmic adaptor subunit [Desulfobulbaceae bacterium]MBU4151850.1 efflux RND transporter periplasmic adaptor subunit [Pseudomonadota bacterium]MDP2106828.1 efflux RND transporter periplasmic adaptor subunit [Desulfobulbaceae bacterium]